MRVLFMYVLRKKDRAKTVFVFVCVCVECGYMCIVHLRERMIMLMLYLEPATI